MIEAIVKADSVAPHGKRITTLLLTMPKFILAQFNTHRMFSRSAESSRAIPTAKIIERVKTDPVMPVYWGKNVRGMSAGEELSPADKANALASWLSARDSAVFHAEALADLGAAKEVVNRTLEPYQWVRVLVTATEWGNFFRLRLDHGAQPEMQELARCMKEAMDASFPASVGYDGLHLPFGELMYPGLEPNQKGNVAAARCARLSYSAHDGEFSFDRDLKLAVELLNNGHLSPFEHVAYPKEDKDSECANLRGWCSYRTHLGR